MMTAVEIALVTPVLKAAAPMRAYSRGKKLPRSIGPVDRRWEFLSDPTISPMILPSTPPVRNTGVNNPTGNGRVTLNAVTRN